MWGVMPGGGGGGCAGLFGGGRGQFGASPRLEQVGLLIEGQIGRAVAWGCVSGHEEEGSGQLLR